MHYVYILKRREDKKIYIGLTKDLKRRLKEHRFGKVKSTKHYGKLILIYYEAFRNWEDAEEREKQLKYHGQALGQLKRRLKKSFEDNV